MENIFYYYLLYLFIKSVYIFYVPEWLFIKYLFIKN